MASSAGDFTRRVAEEAAKKALNEVSNRTVSDPEQWVLGTLNANRTKVTLPDGSEHDAVIVGSPPDTTLVTKLPDGRYLAEAQIQKIIQVDSVQEALVLRGDLTKVTKLSSGEDYLIEEPPTFTPDEGMFSHSGSHLVLVKQTINSNSVFIEWKLYKNFKLITNEDGDKLLTSSSISNGNYLIDKNNVEPPDDPIAASSPGTYTGVICSDNFTMTLEFEPEVDTTILGLISDSDDITSISGQFIFSNDSNNVPKLDFLCNWSYSKDTSVPFRCKKQSLINNTDGFTYVEITYSYGVSSPSGARTVSATFTQMTPIPVVAPDSPVTVPLLKGISGEATPGGHRNYSYTLTSFSQNFGRTLITGLSETPAIQNIVDSSYSFTPVLEIPFVGHDCRFSYDLPHAFSSLPTYLSRLPRKIISTGSSQEEVSDTINYRTTAFKSRLGNSSALRDFSNISTSTYSPIDFSGIPVPPTIVFYPPGPPIKIFQAETRTSTDPILFQEDIENNEYFINFATNVSGNAGIIFDQSLVGPVYPFRPYFPIFSLGFSSSTPVSSTPITTFELYRPYLTFNSNVPATTNDFLNIDEPIHTDQVYFHIADYDVLEEFEAINFKPINSLEFLGIREETQEDSSIKTIIQKFKIVEEEMTEGKKIKGPQITSFGDWFDWTFRI
jgi:hypothetical protein